MVIPLSADGKTDNGVNFSFTLAEGEFTLENAA
jgi:hypothetical protein